MVLAVGSRPLQVAETITTKTATSSNLIHTHATWLVKVLADLFWGSASNLILYVMFEIKHIL